MSKTLPPMRSTRESIFAHTFLFLDFFDFSSAGDSHLHQFSSNLHNLQTLLLLFFSSFDNNFIPIVHSNHCVQNRKPRGLLKIVRYSQRLTHRACIYGRGKLLLMGSFVLFYRRSHHF